MNCIVASGSIDKVFRLWYPPIREFGGTHAATDVCDL